MSTFDQTDFEQRLRARLDPLDREADARVRGDHDLNPSFTAPETFRRAAVLAPIVKRVDGWTMLLTQRSHALAMHAGQVAFPGGRMDAGDATPLDTALRETREEVGLQAGFIDPVGAWDLYQTGTGFRITPIAGFVEPGFELAVDAREVADVFELPMAFLMDPANHEKRETIFQGVPRSYYAMVLGERTVWGATAGMIRALWERLYA